MWAARHQTLTHIWLHGPFDYAWCVKDIFWKRLKDFQIYPQKHYLITKMIAMIHLKLIFTCFDHLLTICLLIAMLNHDSSLLLNGSHLSTMHHAWSCFIHLYPASHNVYYAMLFKGAFIILWVLHRSTWYLFVVAVEISWSVPICKQAQIIS
jgi:hypothetical protein